ncbi:CHAD domain-containing protein [Streptomyces sp. NPDC016626]|uniref:CHAD domain-containing protein n=1 Tax=Streptomyces sp. NPDC016626 TaxID=3364968 RepID=UPI0036F61E9C
MAQRNPDPTAAPVPAEALAGYLRAQATEFLRALRLHRESGAGGATSEASAEAARELRRAARRISASLHTFQPVLDPDWSEAMRPELAWVSGTLALEHACASRLERLLLALHRLSGATALPAAQGPGTTSPKGTARAPATAAGRAPDAAGVAARTAVTVSARTSGGAHGTAGRTTPAAGGDPGPDAPAAPGPTGSAAPWTATATVPAPDRGNLTVGAAKAGALLDRQLTLARTRAHSTALQALGSSRFHGIADRVAVLASEVPLTPAASGADLRPLAEAARERLADAVGALPLLTAGSPYNAEALIHGLSPDPAPHPQDAPWHQVRLLLRLHRYAREALGTGDGGDPPVDVRLLTAGEALDRHRDASEAAAAAAHAARTPRIAPATAYALGVLHADQRHEVEAARYAFQRCWQKHVIGTP